MTERLAARLAFHEQNPKRVLLKAVLQAVLEMSLIVLAWLVLGEHGIWIGLAICLWSLRTIFSSSYHPVLAIRVLALTIPGMAAAIMKLMNPSSIVSVFLIQFQTQAYTAKIVLLCACAGSAAVLAWHTAQYRVKRPSELSRASKWLRTPAIGMFAIAIVALILDAPGRGTPIWNSAYGYSEYGSRLLGVNVFGALGTAALASWAGLALWQDRPVPGLRLAAILTLAAFCLDSVIRGERSETVAVLTGVYAILAFKYRILRGPKTILALMTASVVFGLVLGSVRVYLMTPYDPFTNAVDSLRLFDLSEVYINGVSYQVYKFAAVPFIGMSFLLYGVVGMIQGGEIGFLLGSTYLDHLINTLPEALNPWRREGVSWFLTSQGHESAGGMLEVAEAYLNGGLVGVFVVSFLISYLFFYVTIRAERSKDVGWIALAGACGTLVVRATLYGTNDLYKALLAYLLCVVTISFFRGIVRPAGLPWRRAALSELHMNDTVIRR